MVEIRGKSIIDINVNGSIKSIAVRPADTLLYVLREQLGLTKAKNCCENGDCDECTILIDGWPVKACLMLAVEAMGHDITTIEALKDDSIQSSLVEKFALQGGYCIPGIIMNCHAIFKIYPDATDDVLEEWMESNICGHTEYHKKRQNVKSVMA